MDHTSLSGYERDTTPNLRRIAERDAGRSFDSCISHAVWTLASSASILSGTYPSHHGAGMSTDVFPETLSTVPERLGEQGYHTVGLSPNSHLSAGTGLDRGFDEFRWFSKSTLLGAAGPRTLLKYLLQVNRHGPGLTTDSVKHGTGYMINDVAKRTLRSFAGDADPGFLYVHHGDPHHPYYPPKAYFDRYLDTETTPTVEAKQLALRHHDDLNQLIAEGCPFTDDEWRALIALYDASIAYTDALVGSLFEAAQEALDDVVFVVTADHGELFGEQGLLAHKIAVDDAVSHVPLVVHGSDACRDHESELVQHIDVVRTLLGAVDADVSGLQGLDLGEERRDYCLTQRHADRSQRNLAAFRRQNPDFDDSRYHEGTVHALRDERFKYVQSENEAALHLLPDEETDRSAAFPRVAETLQETLATWLDAYGKPVQSDGQESEFTDAMREQLADLGYLVD